MGWTESCILSMWELFLDDDALAAVSELASTRHKRPPLLARRQSSRPGKVIFRDVIGYSSERPAYRSIAMGDAAAGDSTNVLAH